jgi:serine/threonine-protein kinase RsbW
MMGSIERKYVLHVPSSTENLSMIREFVTQIGTLAGLTDSDVGNLELAVDEACANVIEHAYGHDQTKEVIIRATFTDEEVRIDVIDTGRGFDPNTVPQEMLDKLIADHKSGGLGLRLMKTLMDEVHYEIIPGVKNELHMMKKIRKNAGGLPDNSSSH